MGENNIHSNKLHKIGMGKPLGLGSIKITIDEVIERNIIFNQVDCTISYELKKNDDLKNNISNNKNKFNPQILEQVIKAYTVISSNIDIKYPKGVNDEGKETTFNWFVANKSIKTSSVKPKINKELPKLTDDNLSLPIYIKE